MQDVDVVLSCAEIFMVVKATENGQKYGGSKISQRSNTN